MTRNRVILGGVVALLLVLAGAAAVWAFVLGDTEEASGPIEAAPVVATDAESNLTIFAIIQAESEASFTLGEILRGAPTTVVGTTDQVAGEIAVNPDDPGAAQVGIIQINARTLATDNQLRNRAIRNTILQTDDYEFITFTPTALSGLPQRAAVGEAFTFQVRGDLTIRDVTQEATFEVKVTPISETRIEGLASTTVNRADFDLRIPSVPSVADVDEQVILELDFVAVANN